MSCPKHPKYTGHRKPTNECVGCLALYIQLLTPRLPHKPTRSYRDKSKYTRKTKHKGKQND